MSIKIITAVITSIFVGACSAFGIRSGYEQPDYAVIDTINKNVEIRRYGPRLAAQTTVEASDREDGRNAAFRILFDYISGANSGQTKISMTAPVATDASPQPIEMTAPVATDAIKDDQLVMRFFLPDQYTEQTAPKPTDLRVRLVALPKTTLAVLRFSGSSSEETVNQRRQDLLEAIEGSNWRPLGDPTAFFYDPPWTLPFLRRNEVAAAVQPRLN